MDPLTSLCFAVAYVTMQMSAKYPDDNNGGKDGPPPPPPPGCAGQLQRVTSNNNNYDECYDPDYNYYYNRKQKHLLKRR